MKNHWIDKHYKDELGPDYYIPFLDLPYYPKHGLLTRYAKYGKNSPFFKNVPLVKNVSPAVIPNLPRS